MTATILHCQIRVKGHLSNQWTDWFSGLAIDNQPQGEALLSGTLPDQAALSGVLNRMWDLGLSLVSVSCVEHDRGSRPVAENGNDTATRQG